MKSRIFTLCICMTCLGVTAYGQASNVKDILVGPSSAILSYESFAINSSRVFFSAESLNEGVELWMSDGSESGTILLKDIRTGSKGSEPHGFTRLNDKIYFIARDDDAGTELWVTDGTEQGTYLLKDVEPGSGGGLTFNFSPMTTIEETGIFLFAGMDYYNGIELWKSDGTEAGTTLVKNLATDRHHAYPLGFTVMNEVAYFSAIEGEDPFDSGSELFRTDGTANGTYLVKDINPSYESSFPTHMTVAGDRLFFVGNTDEHGRELWITDGTEAGTVLVKDIWPGYQGGMANSLLAKHRFPVVPISNNVIFEAKTAANEYNLWASDGTSNGTTILKSFPSQTDMSDWAIVNDKVYLLFDGQSDVQGLWVTDGTVAGTQRLVDFSLKNQTYTGLTVFNGKLIVSASRGAEGLGIYKTDATESGTKKITNAANGVFYGVIGNKLYFTAFFAGIGRELWVYDATTTAVSPVLYPDDIQVFPNPANNWLSLKYAQQESILSVELYDLLGRTITSWNHADALTLPYELSPGVYHLHIRTEDASCTKQVLIQRQ